MDHPATAPTTFALNFGGDQLRITCGEQVVAEQPDARRRWTRVWPRGRVLEPDPDGGFRNTSDWQLPEGLGWREVFSSVPDVLLSKIARFPILQWRLLEFAHNHAAFRDLLESNAVLAYALACNDELRHTPPDQAAGRAHGWAARKQRELAHALGFPATENSVRVLGKVLPEAVNPSSLRMLRDCLPFDAKVAKWISHLPELNAGTLAFLVQKPMRAVLSPSLLRELTASADERSRAPSADLLSDTLRMGEGIPEWALPVIRSRARIREVHDRTLLEHLAEQERLHRLSEARVRAAPPVPPVRAAPPPGAGRTADPPQRFPDPPIPGNEDIVPIQSEADLRLEGLQQRNCVGALSQSVRAGRRYFYRVLKPERATLSLVSVSGGRWARDELCRKANQPVSRRTVDAVKLWLATTDGYVRGWDASSDSST